jgi:hypothetical protein
MLSIFEDGPTIETEIYARIQLDFGDVSEEEYDDKLYDIVHEELDDYVNVMWNSEVDRLLTEIGFDKAMKTYMDEYGAIEPGITSKTLLYVCIHNELNERMSYEKFVACVKV